MAIDQLIVVMTAVCVAMGVCCAVMQCYDSSEFIFAVE